MRACRDLAVLFIVICRTLGLAGLGPEPWAGCARRACCGCDGGEAGAAQPLTGYFRSEDIEAELEASIQLETDSASL